MTTGSQPSERTELPDRLSPIRREDFGFDQARHLLWRIGFGGTPKQIQTLVTWGPEKAVDTLLSPSEDEQALDDAGFDANIMRPPTDEERALYRRARRSQDEDLLAQLRQRRQQRQVQDRRQIRQMQRWWLTRMIESPSAAQEKLTLFWHGHFATSYRTIEDSYHMFQQNQMLRANALGNFGDMLFAIIRDPAMLEYLDNDQSSARSPNENLARELMELFSLGLGHYTERDIKEGARALTGYTFYDDRFTFIERDHDDGNKRILGRSGRLDGDDFVRAILERRACAPFICRKLYHFLVHDVPESFDEIDRARTGAIRDMSRTMLRHRYDITPALRELLLSEHFYHESNLNQKIKSPAELVAGAVRSLHTPVRDLTALLDAMDLMGQNLFFPPSVKGWAGGRTWINTSTLFVRQNVLAFLLTGRKTRGYDVTASTEPYDPLFLLEELGQASPGAERDVERVIDYLLRFTLGRAPSTIADALADFAKTHGGRITPDVVRGMLLIITAAPEYQLT